MKKALILWSAVLLTSCFPSKEKIQILPDAELGKPYSTKIEFSNGQRTSPHRFHATISPSDSGLYASGATGPWNNETVISGTPKTKQNISIEIFYVIKGPVDFGESHEQTKYYEIRVKE